MKKVICSFLFPIMLGLPLFIGPISLLAQTQTKLFNSAIELYRQKEYQRAIDTFTKVLNLTPDHLESLRLRGSIYMQLNKLEAAIKDFEKAVLTGPDTEGVFSDLGTAWYYNKNFDKALENYNTEIGRGHENHLVYFNRALCFEQLGEIDKALEDLSKSLTFKPDFYWGYCFRGNLLFHRKDYANAAKSYQKAVAIDDKDPYAIEKLKKLSAHIDLRQKTAAILPEWTIQSGAFLVKENAVRLKQKLNDKGIETKIVQLKGNLGRQWYMVRSGVYSDKKTAQKGINRFTQLGIEPIVRPAGDW